MRILAVDPGYERVGVAVLEKENSGGARETLLFSECFKTSAKLPHSERLKLIGEEIKRMIATHRPSALAIEKLFFANNQKTAILVSEARGVIICEAARSGLFVAEFTPLQAKVAVTGYGRGTKSQMKFMVEKLISVGKKIKEDDEYDAIALGLTFFAYKKESALGK
ncbi:MAG: hypothetical protein A2836_00750 [Candidatus Taylorbacteria bacterium RIFCSPHIGHO2_01_FULL_45_63]|uniref:Crossover junction endodeoxyribonuclease RuvC n=1 Tax=Candidatus Taylorbacteria bacterium RIFCSPHIGHO2_02_FULL_45_35 TaxID=1802311 RepID=A0A1G2MTD1_9BACT|nr:MAG: hypothetical protein A2836_00750 [Candidatus Taylorbacteria bacterium RIFCSPHIGHO2_01_FULL_45_63]OHA27147.1 MAG: hypothetical protein A3D56_03450 [Candidatus Taylorbacteria bacterium RIFCSPHIGHO2_02_FULL_45_35]OHA33847.1 MAG: hypothetical protein A3A22_01425 [Candidatus Taylorbacteria bacterium RIFCSPLOWO2_01_FULL_45_34b]